MNNETKIVKESSIHLAGTIIGIGLNFVWLKIMTTYLSPENFGFFTLAQSVINLGLIFVYFGTPKALDRYIPFFNAQGEYGKSKTLILKILKYTLITGVVIGSLIVIFSSQVANSLFDNKELTPLIQLMVLSIPFMVVIQLATFTFNGFKELRYGIYLNKFIFPILKIGLALIVFGLGFELIGWLFAYIASLILTSCAAVYYLIKKVFVKYKINENKKIDIKQIINYAWPLSLSSLLLIFLGEIDFIILGANGFIKEIAVYRIYIYLASFLTFIINSITTILKPVTAGLIATDKSTQINNTFKRVTKWMLIVNSFILAGFLFLAKDFIAYFFSPDYTIFFIAFFFIIGSQFFNSLVGPQGVTLEAYGRTRFILFGLVIMSVINIVLDIVLIPIFNITGAAMATGLALIIVNIIFSIGLFLYYKIHPFNKNYLKLIACLVLSFVFSYFIVANVIPFGNELVVKLVSLLTFYIIVFFLILRFNIMDKIDKEILIQFKSKLGFRK
jgi:O-antigen/teichoic acid export membrane protein